MTSNNLLARALDESGIPGPTFLKNTLRSCTMPLHAIDDFQFENGILLPSLRTMLPLLDLHGVRRLDFHTSVFEILKDRFIKCINDICQKEEEKNSKLKALLEKSFPFVHIPALRPVIMSILCKMPSIEEKYLQVLLSNQELYNNSDIKVKQQIWKHNLPLFGNEVRTFVGNYVTETELILVDHLTLSNSFFTAPPKVRRQREIVKKLANMIGTDVQFYNLVVQFLRRLFVETGNSHYCTLRAELLMSLHDKGIHNVTSADPCHKFTWFLDTLVGGKTPEATKSGEMQSFLDTVTRGGDGLLGDVSMILCDPYVMNYLGRSIVDTLRDLMNTDQIPEDHQLLILILRMLTLGLSAWSMIKSQDFEEPNLDSQNVCNFMTALMSLMKEDHAQPMNSDPLDNRLMYIQESSVASILAMHYTLYTAHKKKRLQLMQIMSMLSKCKDGQAFENPFLHNLIPLLIQMPHEFQTEDFCKVIFDDYFLAGLSRHNVAQHLLKLLWHVHTELPLDRLQAFVMMLKQCTFYQEFTRKSFEELQVKLETDLDSRKYSIIIDRL